MHALSQSAFLQALGYAIANSLWQVALLWIAVVLLNSIFKFSSAARYKIALYAQFAGFAWFLITLQFYYGQCGSAIAQTQAFANADNIPVVINTNNNYSILLNGMIKTEQLLPYLSFAYLCLLIFLLARLVKNFKSAQYIKTQKLQKTNVEWKLFVRKISSLLNIKSEVKIYLSEIVKSPLTIGFLKPVILIPVASMNNLTTEQMEAVILHELAHIRRADYLINLFQCVIETGLFFNPFTQLLSRIIKKERENSCDDWVLQFQYQPEMYAEALLRIAMFQTPAKLAMHAAKTKGDLLSRVKRMIDRNEKTFNYRQQIVALLLMTCILSSFALLQPASKLPTATANTKKDIKKEIALPAIAQVDNPLFSPTFFLSKPIKEEWSKAVDNAEENSELSKASEAIARSNFSSIIPDALNAVKAIDFSKSAQHFKNIIIPQALDQVKQMHFENAFNEVNDSIKYEWANQFLPDTAQITMSLINTFQQLKTIDFQKIIQQSLEQAKAQMINLKSRNAALNTDKRKAKEAMAEAFEMLKKKSLLPQLIDERNEQTERDKFQEQLNRLQEKIDSVNEAKSADSHIINDKEWKISYPTYIEQTENYSNAAKNFSYAISSSDNINDDSTVIFEVKNKIPAAKKSKGKTSTKSNVHIIKSENGNLINVTIEIL